MTVVGKLLVFLNLVFSLIVGGLIMVLFITRPNWEKAFNDLKAQNQAITADRDQTVQEMEAARLDFNARLKSVAEERDDAMKDRDKAQRAQARAEEEAAKLRADERKQSA